MWPNIFDSNFLKSRSQSVQIQKVKINNAVKKSITQSSESMCKLCQRLSELSVILDFCQKSKNVRFMMPISTSPNSLLQCVFQATYKFPNFSEHRDFVVEPMCADDVPSFGLFSFLSPRRKSTLADQPRPRSALSLFGGGSTASKRDDGVEAQKRKVRVSSNAIHSGFYRATKRIKPCSLWFPLLFTVNFSKK